MPYVKIKKKSKKNLKRKRGNFNLPREVKYVDYKNIELISRFINAQGKIIPAISSGLTANQQRAMSLAIKRARFMALIPFYIDRVRK